MAAALTATALAGEPLDALAWRVLGTTEIEPILAANRGLAELCPFLPEGHVVTLPAPAATPAAPALVQLWD